MKQIKIVNYICYSCECCLCDSHLQPDDGFGTNRNMQLIY
jgi:hypothetical protein